jgi:hypothetical protein
MKRYIVLERQVILDVAAGDWAAAADSLARMSAVWARLKPSILLVDGGDVAAEFDAGLQAQAAAVTAEDGATLTAEAVNWLELVDALKGLY